LGNSQCIASFYQEHWQTLVLVNILGGGGNDKVVNILSLPECQQFWHLTKKALARFGTYYDILHNSYSSGVLDRAWFYYAFEHCY
jgi:hypothetical protein